MTGTTQAANAAAGTASAQFLAWLQEWRRNLSALDLAAFLRSEQVKPDQVALISADLIEGFCYHGPLASPRIANIVEPSARLMQRAYDLGVRQFVLAQEYHTHDAPEFDQFGAHCVRGTAEADTVVRLKNLPFSDIFKVVHKNSLQPALHTGLDIWLAERPQLNTFITVGDCTDLCLYQLAMYLKLNANALNKHINVIVPENCVQTYDLPVETAKQIGTMPHDGDLLHDIFLYHMALNGALVVSDVI